MIEAIKIVIAFTLAYLMIASVTGAFQAWVAYKLGDSTARSYGMMSINPFVHVNPISLIVIPIVYLLLNFVIGLSNPVPIVWGNIRQPWRRFKLLLIAFSQPIAIIVMIIIFVALRLVFIFFVIKTGVNEFLHAYQYIFEAVVGFSVWFIPYELLMALAQIFIYEQKGERVSVNQTFFLSLVPFLGTLLLRNISYAFLIRFIALVNGGLIAMLKCFITV